jgi:glyoxylase I family protein
LEDLAGIVIIEMRTYRAKPGMRDASFAGRTCSVEEEAQMAQTTESRGVERHTFVKSVHGIRYQVKDVARAVAFYTQHLGFTLEHQQLPAFASVSLGDTRMLLSGPGASGSRPMPNGEPQEPGGWNRVVLKVSDLPALVGELKKTGLRFRNTMETGPGGRQVQIEDPDGNPIELFEPAR